MISHKFREDPAMVVVNICGEKVCVQRQTILKGSGSSCTSYVSFEKWKLIDRVSHHNMYDPLMINFCVHRLTMIFCVNASMVWYRNIQMCMVWAATDMNLNHNSDVMIRAMASQITGVSIVYIAVSSGADQRKHQRSTSLDFMRAIPRTKSQ